MITTKSQLISVLILAVICASVLAAEPNEPGAASKLIVYEEPNQSKTELTFEISTEEREFKTEEHIFFEGSIKPKYVAIFTMSDLSKFYRVIRIGGVDAGTCAAMLATSAGKSMSEIQKELLETGKVISTIGTKVKKKQLSGGMYSRIEETEFGLYAFTLDDAKLVTKAFIETMYKKAREELPPLLEKFMNERKQKLQEYQNSIADFKKKLAEKEPELKSAESAYRKFKNTDRYKIFADTDADEKTRKTIAQMNEMLSIIDIELAGIREKLNVIEQYRKSVNFSKATLDKLEQMFVEQMVELKGTEGRKQAAIKLRDQDKQFCNLYDAWTGLYNEVQNLRIRIDNDEKNVRFIEEEIANPPTELLPPKVLRNKVTVYPVLAEEALL